MAEAFAFAFAFATDCGYAMRAATAADDRDAGVRSCERGWSDGTHTCGEETGERGDDVLL